MSMLPRSTVEAAMLLACDLNTSDSVNGVEVTYKGGTDYVEVQFSLNPEDPRRYRFTATRVED